MSRYQTPEMRAYFRRYYHENKAKKIEIQLRYREAKLDKFFDTLGPRLQCVKCPEADRACLDFHHRDPATKVGNVVEMARNGSLSKALQEAEKCDVLCSNCHRKLHHAQRTLAGQ